MASFNVLMLLSVMLIGSATAQSPSPILSPAIPPSISSNSPAPSPVVVKPPYIPSTPSPAVQPSISFNSPAPSPMSVRPPYVPHAPSPALVKPPASAAAPTTTDVPPSGAPSPKIDTRPSSAPSPKIDAPPSPPKDDVSPTTPISFPPSEGFAPAPAPNGCAFNRVTFVSIAVGFLTVALSV